MQPALSTSSARPPTTANRRPALPNPTQPNFYRDKKSPSGKLVSLNDYVGCCFVNDWNWHAAVMSCPDGNNQNDPKCRRDQFAGPAWGHIHMYPSSLEWFLK